MKRAEEEEENVDDKEIAKQKKMSLVEGAILLFQEALSIAEDHAEGLYNLAMAELELIEEWNNEEDGEGDDESVIMENIKSKGDRKRSSRLNDKLLKPCNLLQKVIKNDTSRRGETTGLAHRLLAMIFCKFFDVFVGKEKTLENMLKEIKSHIITSATILSNHADLDCYLFESCEVFHEMMAKLMHKFNSIEAPLEEKFRMIATYVNFVRSQLEECLQTPQSSGIDFDVKLFDAAVLDNVLSFLVRILGSNKLYFDEEKKSFIVETIKNAVIVYNSLTLFVPDDAQAQEVVGDLLQHSMEAFYLVEWEGSDEGLEAFNIELTCKKLLVCRAITAVKLQTPSSMLSLADDIKEAGDRINNQSTQEWASLVFETTEICRLQSSGALNTLFEVQKVYVLESRPYFDVTSGAMDCDDKKNGMTHSEQLYSLAKKAYELAFESNAEGNVSNNKDRDDDVTDIFSTLHYNCMCVCWKLRDSEGCRAHCKRYIELEMANGSDAKMDAVLLNMKEDDDLVGIENADWFLKIAES